MSQVTAHYRLDPCRKALGDAIHAELARLLPEGGTLALGAAEIARLLEQPPETKLGDYALPCFRFAKDLKKKPPEVAFALATALRMQPLVEKAEVANAFLNVFVDKKTMAAESLPKILDGSYFRDLAAGNAHAGRRVMIEYSQPNTHKEFHVGHGRNVLLGNAVVRLYRYAGYDVVGANYFGDDGTHISTVLWYMTKEKLEAPATDRGEWLGSVYVRSKRALSEATDEVRKTYQAEISAVHRQIETQQGEVYELWKKTRQWSLDDFAAIYKWLDVSFDVLFYESEETEEAQKIVDEFLAKGVFVLDDGAVGVDLKPHKLGFCILRKRDGNTLYATKDLSLARKKFDRHKVARSVYVVGDEQNHHFKQVFKVLELMGFEQAKQCHHLSYGMVVLPEGKMSSRDGTSVPFMRLRDAMTVELDKILAKYAAEWSPAEIADAAHRLCDGAIKYGMVATDPSKEIVFDVADWLSFDGNSGPYLMYSYARTASILRKASEQGARPVKPSAAKFELLTHPAEHELVRYLYDFNQVAAAAAELYKPSLVASHLFYACKSFNRFYAEVPVLKTEDAALRDARLGLTEAFNKTLAQGLGLLGIRPPERM